MKCPNCDDEKATCNDTGQIESNAVLERYRRDGLTLRQRYVMAIIQGRGDIPARTAFELADSMIYYEVWENAAPTSRGGSS